MLCCLLAFVVCLPAASAQNRKDLENRRKALIKEIRLTGGLLKETARSRAAAYDRYIALQNQIKAREELIETLHAELLYVDSNIQRTNGVIIALEDDIGRLEEEYSKMARKAIRQKMNYSKLLFLFSARSFNQAYQRWRYLKQYDAFRMKQARLIIDTRRRLMEKVEKLEIDKVDKAQLIEEAEQQKHTLSRDMKAKNRALQTLRADEQRLRRELKEGRKLHQELNNAIESVIRRDMAASRKGARSPKALRDKTDSSPGSTIHSSNFRRNKGRLPWPVGEGVITRYFGKQAHPTLRKIEISNNGIDIRTPKNASVRAVFNGTVVGVQYVPGYNNMLIVKHGDYYTVYSNLREVFVKKGDKVRTKQAVGRVGIDKKSNKSEVHFEVWRDKQRLNPVHWISRK